MATFEITRGPRALWFYVDGRARKFIGGRLTVPNDEAGAVEAFAESREDYEIQRVDKPKRKRRSKKDNDEAPEPQESEQEAEEE